MYEPAHQIVFLLMMWYEDGSRTGVVADSHAQAVTIAKGFNKKKLFSITPVAVIAPPEGKSK